MHRPDEAQYYMQRTQQVLKLKIRSRVQVSKILTTVSIVKHMDCKWDEKFEMCADHRTETSTKMLHYYTKI